MLRSLQQPKLHPNTVTLDNPFPKEIVYTISGRIGFLVRETAHTVTIQVGPDMMLTLPKDEVDHRLPVV